MNDEFLVKFHKTPRAEFANALYKRLSQQPQPRFTQTLAKSLNFRNAVVVFMFLFLVAACVQAVTHLWHREKVGDIWVEVQSGNIEVSSQEMTPAIVSPQVNTLPLADAEQTYFFDIKVPEWMPAGFTWDGNATVWGIGTNSTTQILWKNDSQGETIVLTVRSLKYWNPARQNYLYKSPYTPEIASGGFEEVKVNGESAVLVRGDWVPVINNKGEGATLKWDKSAALLLCWSDDGFLYWLRSDSKSVSASDLIKMAESAR